MFPIGPLIALFLTSGDISFGFQIQSGQSYKFVLGGGDFFQLG